MWRLRLSLQIDVHHPPQIHLHRKGPGLQQAFRPGCGLEWVESGGSAVLPRDCWLEDDIPHERPMQESLICRHDCPPFESSEWLDE